MQHLYLYTFPYATMSWVLWKYDYSFIQQTVLNTCCIPGTRRGSGHTKINKTWTMDLFLLSSSYGKTKVQGKGVFSSCLCVPGRRWAHNKYLTNTYVGKGHKLGYQYTQKETSGKKEIHLSYWMTLEWMHLLLPCRIIWMAETILCKKVGLCMFYTFLILLQYFMRQELILISSPSITPKSSKDVLSTCNLKNPRQQWKLKVKNLA